MPAIDPFEAERKALQSLMGENRFFIPDLQRPFSWGEEQVEDLINDINSVLRANRNGGAAGEPERHGHFLGTIVTQTEPAGARLAILDGQQRMTCLTLLIALVAKEARLLLGRCTTDAETERVRSVVGELERLILQQPDGTGNRAPRLEASPEIRETLASFVRGGNGEIPNESLAPAMNLRHAASLLQGALLTSYREKDLEGQILYFVALQRCICQQLLTIHMTTHAGSAAFSIFESLNARGEPLAMLDLLKIWVMSEMVGHPDEAEVTHMLRSLATSRFTAEEPDKYFEAYFTVRNKGVRPRANGRRREKLFSIEFRDHLLMPDGDPRCEDHDLIRKTIVSTFRHAMQLRPLYDSIANRQHRDALPIQDYPVQGGSAFHQSRLDALVGKTLGNTQAIPLLLRAAEQFQGQVAATHSLVHDLERLFFRIKTISSCHAQVLSHAYRTLFEAIDDGTYSDAFRRAKFQDLIDQHSPDERFVADLRQQLQYEPNRGNKIKYFLWMIELYSANNPPAPGVFDLQSLSIEHVFPQAGDHDHLDNGVDDLHRLGNLCLLTPPENASLSNLPFDDKRAKVLEWQQANRSLECHHSRHVFNDHDRWGTAEIEQAENLLCARAVEIFRF